MKQLSRGEEQRGRGELRCTGEAQKQGGAQAQRRTVAQASSRGVKVGEKAEARGRGKCSGRDSGREHRGERTWQREHGHVDTWGEGYELGLLAVVHGQTLEEQRSETGASASTDDVEHHEALA